MSESEASPPVSERGLHVALLGIDGIGKSTFASDLAQRLTDAGHHVEMVSWRSCLDRPPPGIDAGVLAELERLWVESFRLYYAGANHGGVPVELPSTRRDIEDRGGTDHLADVELHGLEPVGPLASAFIELAGNTLLHDRVIRRLVERGVVVIQESFPYKHLFKALAFTRYLDPAWSDVTDGVLEHLAEEFSGALRPDVGVFLDGPPDLALRWRTAQTGAVGAFESFSAGGADPRQSFLELSALMREDFTRFASDHSWVRVTVDASPIATINARAYAALAGTPLGPMLGD